MIRDRAPTGAAGAYTPSRDRRPLRLTIPTVKITIPRSGSRQFRVAAKNFWAGMSQPLSNLLESHGGNGLVSLLGGVCAQVASSHLRRLMRPQRALRMARVAIPAACVAWLRRGVIGA